MFFCYYIRMAYTNLEDYIVWRGDLTFAQVPFSLPDAIILAELAYVNYLPVGLQSFGNKSMPLKEAGEKITELGVYELKTLDGGHESFFRKAYQSARFGNVLLRYYEDVFDPENDTQYSAVHFQYGAHQTFIAFRGTDASITGWKEDFMITFTNTGSQRAAASYLQRTMNEADMKYTVGGHSKGGNLAMYAAANLPSSQRDLIDQLYVFDAPGFAPDVFSRRRLDPFLERITAVSPEFCIISRIYEIPFRTSVIVKSSGVATGQHDIMTWLTQGPSMRVTDKHNPVSDKLMEVMMRWATGESIEGRKIFVNELFDALSAGGATDITKVTRRGFLKVLEALSKTSPEAREVLAGFGKAAFEEAKETGIHF